ncbi:E3 ubiquitin-protein ligase RNF168 isoform X2 [Tachyglossus aculeatus]|uniref:E3 ubiquitin-protein ligase RNF168 isoform X2 n=1 Tax=Tachyglossus aculeatus TaxID=9261 RepID=UPI0018F5D69C|nr:E3 ubiquitin-protein ligase RNF168 isoform X2 [Tachyglossus aculeatus]
MARLSEAPLSLSECQCQICTEILIEPVTLPCNHTLCKSCFQLTVEKANLYCPFCRRRVSTWARYHARSNTLIDVDLWERIQKNHPEECRRRASGQETQQDVDSHQPERRLSKPGELRQEYEEEISKVEAERRAYEEEERKASAEYIQRLLKEEEEEEQRQAEQRRWEVEKQLKLDEEIARKLSINLNKPKTEGGVFSSSLTPKQSDPTTPKTRKSGKTRPRSDGDIQKYLSPKAQSSSVPASQPDPAKEGTSSSLSKDPGGYNTARHGRWEEEEEEEEGMPTLSPQTFPGVQDGNSMESLGDSPMPQLRAFSGGERERMPDDPSRGASDDAKAGVGSPSAGAAELGGETEGGPTPSRPARITADDQSQAETDATGQPVAKDALKRKDQGLPPETADPVGFSGKKRKTCPEATSDQEETQSSLAQKLVDLERLLFERHRQEEEDRLLALELQREVDREQQPNRQKGSPDEYLLRAKPPGPRDEAADGQRSRSRERAAKRQTAAEHQKPWRGPKDENWQPPPKSQPKPGGKAPASFRNSSRHPSKDAQSLRPCNSQKKIFQMFQRSAE